MEDSESIQNSNQMINEMVEYIDIQSFNRIINKLTDYAEILSEGKLSGIVNFSFNLNRSQTNKVIDLLLSIQALSRIYTIALKGSRDLEYEYVSNIFSEETALENLSSYLSLRTLIENRLSHQIQQYNMNMGKHNTTLAMPLNELRAHVKTYTDLSSDKLTVSTKVQHGMIAASLHDAYITILNKSDYANDKTYMKFFFSDDDPSKRDQFVVTKEIRISLYTVMKNIEEVKERLNHYFSAKQYFDKESKEELKEQQAYEKHLLEETQLDSRSRTFTDRMLLTPFGKQYGVKIDAILNEIFLSQGTEGDKNVSEDQIREEIIPLFEQHSTSSSIDEKQDAIMDIVDYLINQDYSIKTLAEKFLYTNRKESFPKFFTDATKVMIEEFLTNLFSIFFEKKFKPIFRIIKSLDMKRFACAYIMKRIYLTRGDNISNFGFFFIRTIAKVGGIKFQ